MKRFLLALGFLTTATMSAAYADEPPGCNVTSAGILSQDQPGVTINCTGVPEALGNQLAAILTRIVQDRLDPQMALAKLGEVDRIPEEGVARVVDESQRQLIIRKLAGKPGEQIAIIAHPGVDDTAEFARAIATALLAVGWQIEGHQVRRAAPKSLDPVQGVALVVRNKDAPPQKALQLKAALADARIAAQLVSDPAIAPEAATLWIGRRPVFIPTEAAK